jgi:GT2 family glycosyltransferase
MSKNRNKNKPTKKFEMSLVDIIIPVYNRSDLLERCLSYIPDACKKNPYSIYVFDNGSKTGGHGMVGAQDIPEINEAANIRGLCASNLAYYMRNGINIGFPAACNRAARRGGSPLIFFLNDDVFLLPESIDRLIMAMDDPKVGAAGMRLLFPLDSKDPGRPAGKIQHVGLSTNIKGDFFHQYSGWTPENPRTFKIKYPYVVTGAAMMTRRKLFRDAGGFFEGYGIGTYEDVDYCLTIRSMGYNIAIEHSAIGFHLTGATVVSQNLAYPLSANKDLFKLRWRGKIAYSEWDNW